MTFASTTTAREVAALVSMPRLLEALQIPVDARTRRCRCILHGGKNPTAFSWREDGVWHCHSCGAGGDRITLVRTVRQCSFREAIEFLSEIAGVVYAPRQLSRQEIERARAHRERVEAAAWKIRDEVSRLHRHYLDALHRSDRLWCRFGEDLLRTHSENQRDLVWGSMERLAIAATFFLAAYDFFCRSDAGRLTRFAVSTPKQRRILILGEMDDNDEFEGPRASGTVPPRSRS